MGKHQINEVVLEGNLLEDPKLREVANRDTGEVVSFASLRVANNRTRGGNEQANYVNVEASGHAAKFAGQYLHKGDEVIVVGELQQDRWEDKETGAKRSMLLIRAREVNGRRKAGSGSGGGFESQAEPEAEYAPASREDDIPF